MMEIKWKKGARVKCAPEKAHAVIERIRKKHDGKVLPADVVKEARKPRNPLHKDFEWDDAKAAQVQREERARDILRSFIVIREKAPNVESRQYEVRVLAKAEAAEKGEPERVYQTTEDILADPIQREKLLGRAIQELGRFRERYAALSELAVVFQAIDDVAA